MKFIKIELGLNWANIVSLVITSLILNTIHRFSISSKSNKKMDPFVIFP